MLDTIAIGKTIAVLTPVRVPTNVSAKEAVLRFEYWSRASMRTDKRFPVTQPEVGNVEMVLVGALVSAAGLTVSAYGD